MSDVESELKVTKRIDAARVSTVLKQNRDSMEAMDRLSLQALIRQAEVDMKRCAEASEVLREITSQLADVMLTAVEVAQERGVAIP